MSLKTLAKRYCQAHNIPRSRRGSVLVLIVGVLAMIALLVLVYSTLGQADRRSSASLSARVKLTEQAASVRDYLAKTIGDSTFNHTYQRDVLGNDRLVRTVFDYPYTDPEFRSSRVANLPANEQPQFTARKFSPTGQVNGPWVNAGQVNSTDPRMGTGQPWLASSEAGIVSDVNNRRLESGFSDPNRPSNDYRDWMHLSNFAPSGNPVTKYMLRQNVDQPEAGAGFDVASGVWSGTGVGTFTYKLTMRDPNNPANVNGSVWPPAGAYSMTRADGTAASLNRPSDWFSRQPGLLGLNETNADYKRPGRPEYIWNEFADNDGDGRPDGRWFELVDVSDPDAPSPVVNLQPGYRWVFSARAIDLSGRVNVNTAWQSTQFDQNVNQINPLALVPTLKHPFGLTPAEVDLQRLLMQPWAFQGQSGPITTSLYALSGSDLRSEAAPGYGTDYVQAAADLVGGGAYAAIIDARLKGTPPAQGRYFPLGTLPGDRVNNRPVYVDLVTPNGLLGNSTTQPIVTRENLQRAYDASRDPEGGVVVTRLDQQNLNNPAREKGVVSTTSFDLSDMLELLTYGGANDPSVTSRLEQTADGRASNSNVNTGAYPELGPLRSNRELKAERAPKNFTSANDALDSLSLMYSDLRSKLTTISGARPLASRVFTNRRDPALDVISAADTRPDINGLVNTALATNPEDIGLAQTDWNGLRQAQYLAINRIFKGYADALLPYSDMRGDNNSRTSETTPWASGTSRSQQARQIQSYAFGPLKVPSEGGDLGRFDPRNEGERSPISTAEFALRRAAHMTLNLLASRDIDKGGAHRPDLRDDQLKQPVGPKDEIVGATVIFGTDYLLNQVPNAGERVLRSSYGLSDVQVGSTVLPGDPQPVAMFPFAAPQNNTQGRELTRTASGGGQIQGFQRATLLNLDYLKYRIDGTLQPGATQNSPPDRLDSRNANVVARPVNMFGIKPQPFVTSAVAHIMYTDTPKARGGDEDWKFDENTGEIDTNEQVTIKGDIESSNPDFIFQAVIITLSNPFDTDIDLTSDLASTVDDSTAQLEQKFKYYIEFGGQFYPLVQRSVDQQGTPQSGSATRYVLGAGQSIDFVLLPTTMNRIYQRMRQPLGSLSDQDIVSKWVNQQAAQDGQSAQVGTRVNRQRILFPCDPRTGEIDVRFTSSNRLTVTAPGDSTTAQEDDKELNRQVRLWRAYRQQVPTTLPTPDEAGFIADESTINSRANDILVDRLRDPGDYRGDEPALMIRLKDGQNEIAGTTSGPEPEEGGENVDPLDNIGFSITLTGAIRRPSDVVTTPIGAVPTWCLEAKSNLKRAANYPKWNTRQFTNNVDDADDVNLTRSMFTQTGPRMAGAKTFKNSGQGLLRQQTAGPAASPAQLAIVDKDPEANKPDNVTEGVVLSTDTAQPRRPRYRERPAIWTMAKRLKNDYTSANEASFVPPLKLTDVLRPMAIGAVHDPLRELEQTELADGRNFPPLAQGDARHPAHLDVQWTTLSEALAVAMDADSPYSPNDLDYFVGQKDHGVLDRGQLPLYRVLPFHDINGDGIFSQSGGADPDPDPHVGAGIPFAADIVNQFRVSSQGSSTSMVTGVVNVNTAPRDVLRSLPLMYADEDRVARSIVVTLRDPDTGSSGTSRSLFGGNETKDLAGFLLAYRDKTRVYNQGLRNGSGEWIDMRDGVDTTDGPYVGQSTGDDNGRRVATGVTGLREAPGFQSIGELFMARMVERNNNGLKGGIDGLARSSNANLTLRPEDPASGTEGPTNLPRHISTYVNWLNPVQTVESNQYPILRATDAPANYAMQLVAADAMLNSVSVRSDVFAVWFTMEGYRREDTQGLTVDDPMVPSVKKRYVMVVDRSTVTQKGQLPRVLMMQELPTE